MENNTIYQQKDRSWVWDGALYAAIALFLLALFSYGVFYLKAWIEFKQISAIDEKIALYGTPEQKKHEGQVYDYKKKIDDFAGLLKNHAMPSNVFSFLEANTLEGVAFSGFTFSGARNEMRLSGEAQNMQILGRQFSVFEAEKKYVGGIKVFNSQTLPTGKVSFVFSLSLKPELLAYDE